MAVKTKKVRQKSTGKVLTVYSSDGGKTWSKTDPTKTSKIKKYYTGNTKSKGTTAKERLDAKQKARDEARKPTVKPSETNKETLKKKTSKPNLVQTPSPTWGVKKKKEEKAAKKETPKVTKKTKITTRSRMRARNEEIHGKSMQGLVDKNKDFQAAKKKKGGMDEFAKKYPKSQTAKKRKRRLRITQASDLE